MELSNKILNINTLSKKKKSKKNNYKPIEILVNKDKKKYSIKKYLGRGIYGDLYLVEDKENGEFICKILSVSSEIKKQILLEISILQVIENDENRKYIIPCIDYGIHKNLVYIVFPKFTGYKIKNLFSKLKELNSTNYHVLVSYIIKQLLLGLSIIHKKQIAHQNINDTSILVDLDVKNMEDGVDKINLKFTDFGLSCGVYSVNEEISKLLNKHNKLYSKESFNFKRCLDIPNYFVSANSNYNNSQNINDNVDNNIKSILKGLKNDKYLQLAQLYDVWCCGIIIYNLIYCKSEPDSHINVSILDGIEHHMSWYTKFKIKYNREVHPKLKLYEDLLKNHILVPINNRNDSKYCIDKIIIEEKYNK